MDCCWCAYCCGCARGQWRCDCEVWTAFAFDGAESGVVCAWGCWAVCLWVDGECSGVGLRAAAGTLCGVLLCDCADHLLACVQAEAVTRGTRGRVSDFGGRRGDFSGKDVSARRSKSVGDSGIRRIDSECGGECDEVVLLLNDDVAEAFGYGELVEFVGLLDAAAVVTDGFLLVFEIEAEHFLGFFGGLDGLGSDGGHSAEIVD